MNSEIRVTWRHLPPAPEVIDLLERKSRQLTALYPKLTDCQVLIDRPHRSHRKGNRDHVRVQAAVPGHRLVVCRDPLQDGGSDELRSALLEAFDALNRSLKSHRPRGRPRRTMPRRAWRATPRRCKSPLR